MELGLAAQPCDPSYLEEGKEAGGPQVQDQTVEQMWGQAELLSETMPLNGKWN